VICGAVFMSKTGRASRCGDSAAHKAIRAHEKEQELWSRVPGHPSDSYDGGNWWDNVIEEYEREKN